MPDAEKIEGTDTSRTPARLKHLRQNLRERQSPSEKSTENISLWSSYPNGQQGSLSPSPCHHPKNLIFDNIAKEPL